MPNRTKKPGRSWPPWSRSSGNAATDWPSDRLEIVLVDHTDEVLREALRLEDPDAFFRKLPAGALHTDGTSHPPPSPASEATPAA